MALHFLRLRRALCLTSSILHRQTQPTHPFFALSHILPNAAASSSSSTGGLTRRSFTSTTSLLQSQRGKVYDPEIDDQIGPDTILFEGCDYNHWLITMEFPKDAQLTRDQKIEEYVNTAAQVFGSVEEAKKKIYALSTTTYQGFQVLCSEETSEKFKLLRGVVFVLPDSYIDPVNKEYGGDKYENGEIFPRPPPVHYGRRNNSMDRRPRDQLSYRQRQPNYGQPRQPNFSPPPPHQNNGPPPQQNNGPPPLQNYIQPQPQQNNGPPQQNHGLPPPPPPPPQNYGQLPHPGQNYGPPPQPNNGMPPQQNKWPPPQQNYVPPQQPNYELPHQQQNYRQPAQQSYGQPPNFPPPQNYGPPDSGERRVPIPPQNNAPGGGGANPIPSYSGNFNQREAGNYNNAQRQRDYQQGNLQYQQMGFSGDANYESTQSENFRQASGDQKNNGNN